MPQPEPGLEKVQIICFILDIYNFAPTTISTSFSKKERLEILLKLSNTMGSKDGLLRRVHATASLGASGTIPSCKDLLITAWITCHLLGGLHQPGGAWIQNTSDWAHSPQEPIHFLKRNWLKYLPDNMTQTCCHHFHGVSQPQSNSEQSQATLSYTCQEYPRIFLKVTLHGLP